MLVDEYGQYEKQDVAIISPDDSLDEQEPTPRADDFDAMREHVLPKFPDLETEAETEHTWHIENWRSLPRKEHGPTFECGGSPWRVLFFPYGNNVEYASFYLEQGFEDKPPEKWYACVQFALVLWNPEDPTIYAHHTASHRFNIEEGDWGFTRFVELRKIFNAPWEDRERPMVENDSCNLTAYVRVVKDPTGVLWHNFINYDSKAETGMIGLKNQGATCYLNSLLQSLYFTNAFRKAVYQIPTDEEQERANSAWTLQRLFYQLQTSDQALSTQELTASFGWDSRHIFEQQDVQELSRVLMEKLEERMKGTMAENALTKLFVGKMKTYISCINVPYESSRVEDFWDIQLNVRGNKTLDDSFKDYVQVETMDGDNKYQTDTYGYQEARKGVIFESFPQVLNLQLKRFEYDINRDAMMKVNDRYEFPEEFDASPYLSEDADKSEPWIYQLHGVLVHSGDLNAGHYYAFLRPVKDGHFFKFDDDRVTRATTKEALEENFGGEYSPTPNGNTLKVNPYTRTSSTKRSMSAYMLVYIRKSRVDNVLCEVKDEDIPHHIGQRLADERAEFQRRRKEREEAHLYLNVGVVSEEIFQAHQGFDLSANESDPENPAAPKMYRTLRATKISEFLQKLAEERKVDVDQVRLWVMVNRQNKTTRPDQPLTELSLTVEEVWSKWGSKGNPFRLWLEVINKSEDGTVVWPDVQINQNSHVPVLLFLKHFDTEAQTLLGVGHIYARKHSKVMDLIPNICEMMKWPAGTHVELFEEIKYSMIEPMKPKATLQQSEIQDGDIVCFQQSLTEQETTAFAVQEKMTNPREFYDWMLNRTFVRFVPKLEGEDITIPLSKKMTYEEICDEVGKHLKCDPTHLRFWTISNSTNKPRGPVKRSANQTLSHILYPSSYSYGSYANQRSDALFYEILELPLIEYETKKLLRVIWLSEGITKEDTYEALVAKNGTIGEILPTLKRKANLDDETIDKVRIFEVHGGKVYKELPGSFNVSGVTEYVTLYAEATPEEEQKPGENDRPIFAYHFEKEPNKPHGVPFKFLMKPNEPFKETKERLSKRTGIKGKPFEKIKFAAIQRAAFSKPIYLNDDDILFDIVQGPEDLLDKNSAVFVWRSGFCYLDLCITGVEDGELSRRPIANEIKPGLFALQAKGDITK
ncbi:MAG: hypothetical protein M1834_005046 [Cirrosporium novae-zelandiae]|nr:MAG: hypothetical protein M1834_005046 [Cirrosporium novae-zelandiae]